MWEWDDRGVMIEGLREMGERIEMMGGGRGMGFVRGYLWVSGGRDVVRGREGMREGGMKILVDGVRSVGGEIE